MFQKAKTKFGKLIMLLLVVVCTVCLAIGLVGCSGDARSISSVAINDAGHLIITWSDSEEQDLGLVVGANGEDGAPGAPGDDGATGATGNGIAKVEIDENGNLVVYYTADETTGVTVGPIKGDKGDTGAAGVGIKDITIDENGELVITLTDDTVLRPGTVVGDKGETGATGVGISGIDYDTETGDLTITLSNEQTYTFNIKGQDGANGVGIANIDLKQVQEGDSFTEEGLDVVGTYYWEITYTDSTEEVPHIDRIALPMLTQDVCDHENISTYVLEEHSYVGGVLNPEVRLEVCDDCGWAWIKNDSSEDIHTWQDNETIKAPTCTEPGLKGRVCAECGYPAETTEEIAPLGHNYTVLSQTVVDGANICEDGGFQVQRCTRCGDTQTVEVAPQQHVFENGGTISTQRDAESGLVQVILSGTCVNCHEERSYVLTSIETPDMQVDESEVATFAAPEGAIEIDMSNAYVQSYVAYVVEVTQYQDKCTDNGEFVIHFYVGTSAEDAVNAYNETYLIEGETDHTLAYDKGGEPIQVAVGAPVDLNVYGTTTTGEIGKITVAVNYPEASCAIADSVADGSFVIPKNPQDHPEYSQGDYVCAVCGELVRVITYRSHEYTGAYAAVPENAPTCTAAGYEARTCIWGCDETDPNEANWVSYPNGYGHQWTKNGDVTVTITNYATGEATLSIPVICAIDGCNTTATLTEKDVTITNIELSAEGGATCETACTYTYDITYAASNRGGYTLTWEDVTFEVTTEAYIAACGHIRIGGVNYTEEGYIDLNGALTKAFLAVEGNENFFTGDIPEDDCVTDPFSVSYTCPTCNEVVTAQAVKAHQLPDEYTVKAPTCTTEGSYSYTCTVCGTSVDSVTLDALGHHYEFEFTLTEGDEYDTLVLTAVGCTECEAEINTVIFTKQLKDAGETFTAQIDGTDVSFTIAYSATQQSTCDDEGTGTYSVTFDYDYKVYIPASGSTAPAVKDASETGVDITVSYSDSKALVTIPHKILQYVTDENGNYLDAEGNIVETAAEAATKEVDFDPTHRYIVYGSENEHYAITPYYDELPTCDPMTWAAGWFDCPTCGGRIIVQIGGSHEYGEWTVTTPATCTTPGTETSTCIHCEETKEREIPQTGHGQNGYTVVNVTDPTTSSTGSYQLSCNDCKEVVTTGTIDVLPTAEGTVESANGTYVVTIESGAVCMGVTYSYTYTVTYEGETIAIVTDGWDTFVAATAEHDLGTDAYIWEAADAFGVTWKYTGYLCSTCGNVIATRVPVSYSVANQADLTNLIRNDLLMDGMTIEFGAGTFDLGTFTFSGANGITIKGAGADQTTLVGNIKLGASEEGSATDATFTISDLTLRAANGVSTGINTLGANGANKNNTGVTINITNCVIEGFAWGFQMNTNMASSKVVFSNTDFVNVWCAISIGSFEGVKNSYEIGEGVTFDAVYQLEVFEYNEGIQLIAHNFYAEIGGSATAAESVTIPTEWPVAEEAAA